MDGVRAMRILRSSLALIGLALVLVVLGSALAAPARAASDLSVSSGPRAPLGTTDPTQPLVKAGEDVVVPAGTTVDSAVAFGGDVTVDGTVTDLAMAFGGDIVVDGSVGSSVVAFGGDITVSGSVGASVIAFGGDVRLLPGAVVGTSMKPSDETVVLFGGRLTRDPTAQVTGKTAEYDNANWAKSASWFGGGVGRGIVRPWGGFTVLGWVIQAAICLVLGLVAAALMPKQMRAVQRKLSEKTAASLGWGALTFFVIAPAVLVVLVISIVGLLLVLPYAVVLALFYFFVITSVGALVAGLALKGTRHADNLVLAVVIGVLATTVVSKIPVAGFLVLVVMAVFGAGAAVLAYGEYRRARRAAMTPAPAGGPAGPPLPGTAMTAATAAVPPQPPAYAPVPADMTGAQTPAATTAPSGAEYWPATPPLPPAGARGAGRAGADGRDHGRPGRACRGRRAGGRRVACRGRSRTRLSRTVARAPRPRRRPPPRSPRRRRTTPIRLRPPAIRRPARRPAATPHHRRVPDGPGTGRLAAGVTRHVVSTPVRVAYSESPCGGPGREARPATGRSERPQTRRKT